MCILLVAFPREYYLLKMWVEGEKKREGGAEKMLSTCEHKGVFLSHPVMKSCFFAWCDTPSIQFLMNPSGIIYSESKFYHECECQHHYTGKHF